MLSWSPLPKSQRSEEVSKAQVGAELRIWDSLVLPLLTCPNFGFSFRSKQEWTVSPPDVFTLNLGVRFFEGFPLLFQKVTRA